MTRDIIGRCYAKLYDHMLNHGKGCRYIYMGRLEKEELFEYLKNITMYKSEASLEDPELLGKTLLFVEKESWLEVA